jgi:hypothetical protein
VGSFSILEVHEDEVDAVPLDKRNGGQSIHNIYSTMLIVDVGKDDVTYFLSLTCTRSSHVLYNYWNHITDSVWWL